MADPQIPPTTDQSTSSFIPTSTQPSPNTIYSPTFGVPPTNTTPLATTQSEHAFTYNPSSVVPPFSTFFPSSGQSSSTQQIPPNQFQPNSTIVHTTSTFQPLTQSGFHHPTSQFVQSSGVGGDGVDGGYEEEFEGYEEEGYYYGGEGGNLGLQGGMGYQQSQQLEQVHDMVRQPTGVQPIRPQGPKFQRPMPLQQVQPRFRQPQQFQRPMPQQGQQPPQYQHFAPQGPMQDPRQQQGANQQGEGSSGALAFGEWNEMMTSIFGQPQPRYY
ncbi:hypothetical protein R6Q57_018445 [Mikania cordata]